MTHSKKLEEFTKEIGAVLDRYPELDYIVHAAPKGDEEGQLMAVRGTTKNLVRVMATALQEAKLRDLVEDALKILQLYREETGHDPVHTHDEEGHCIHEIKPIKNVDLSKAN